MQSTHESPANRPAPADYAAELARLNAAMARATSPAEYRRLNEAYQEVVQVRNQDWANRQAPARTYAVTGEAFFVQSVTSR